MKYLIIEIAKKIVMNLIIIICCSIQHFRDGQIRKTVDNVKLQETLTTKFKFTNIDEGLVRPFNGLKQVDQIK